MSHSPRRAGLTCMLAVLALSRCAPVKTATSSFSEATSAECTSAEIPKQFVVRFVDGQVGVIHADSKEAFINGFLQANLGRVRYAEPDYRVKAAMLSTQMTPTTGQADNWGVINSGADTLWKQNIRGDGIAVAVVDSGMDLTHPQLSTQLYENPGEQGLDSSGHDRASNGVDDDANGFIDDVHGWDFTVGKPIAGDNTFHGTHVSGILGAYHSDSTAQATSHVQGLAPNVKILPLAFLTKDGSGSMSDGVKAIEYAASRGVRVINASWGGTMCSVTLRDTIASLASQTILFVSAAGNDASDVDVYKEYPASLNLPSQFTVGATGDLNLMAEYSNYGASTVHIFAPGTDIVSTLPGGTMGALSGTSMATPFVTGALALLLSAEPKATVAQLRQALYETAAKRTDYVNVSQGRLNLVNTLADLRRLMAAPPTP